MRPLALVVLAGCSSGGDRSRPPAAPPPIGSAAAPAVVSPEWRDLDAVPPGALKRLGSQRYMSRASVVAIRDDGMLAVVDDDLGVIEVRTDGRYRVVADLECRSSELVQYVGGELRARCGDTLYTARDGVATSTKAGCGYGISALSRSGEYYACLERTGDTYELRMSRWPSTPLWQAPIAEEPRRLLVTDAGELIVVEQHSATSLVRGGKVVWRKPLALEWSGLAPAHLVGWIGEDRALVRIAIADGAVLGRVTSEHTVARNIAVIGDGGSYFVTVYGRYPGQPPDTAEEFRARIDAKTGQLLAAWRHDKPEWGNAVSPNGKLAASVGNGRVIRVRLDDPKADAPELGERPGQVAISADGKVAGYVTDDSRDNFAIVFDVASGRQRTRSPGPDFPRALEISPDGKRLAIAGQFGGFGVYDAATGAPQCTSDRIAGSRIWWRGSRLIAHFRGDNGDDCDEITEGSITVADDRCNVIKQYVVYGMVQLLETTATRTVVAMADWKNKCGLGFELVPYRAFAIDHRTGAKTPLPQRDGEQAARERAEEEAGEGADTDSLMSADGTTRVAFEVEDRVHHAHCIDAATKRTLARHALPPGVFGPYAISGDGKLLVVSDRGSLLLYRCRT